MTVWIPQQPMPNRLNWSPDFSSAIKYGELKFVFDGGEKVFALPGPSLFKARKAIRGFDHEKDYILWPSVGDPAALFAFMIALMAEVNPPKVNFLYWDRKRQADGTRNNNDGFYVPLRFEIKKENSDVASYR